MKTMKRLSIWLEVTTLVISGLNDDPAEIRDTAAFIAQDLGSDTPWHISRFQPAYKMLDRPFAPSSHSTTRRKSVCQNDVRNGHPQFLDTFRSADVIIARGMAKFEALSGVHANIYLMLKARCASIAQEIGIDERALC